MVADLIPILERADRVVITTHTRPDGDAIGSQVALGHFLRDKGKEVWMINSDPSPYNLEWIPGSSDVLVYDHSLQQVEAIASADAVVVVDTNAVNRLGKPGSQIQGSSAKKLLIDHHTDPEGWFDLSHRRETASSTGELLYELMAEWDRDGITSDVAIALYVAIMTDTGSFRFSNVSPALHRITADLLDRASMDSAQMHSLVYDRKSAEGLRLMAAVLSSLELHFDGAVGAMVVTRQMLEDTGAGAEETDGFVNMLLTIEGVHVALIFTETAKGTKISFRSKGDWEVHKWAQSLGGGGHRNAAGAFVQESLEKTIASLLASAPRFLNIEQPESGSDLSAEDADYLAMLGGG